MLRAMWRELETGLRRLPHGHGRGNPETAKESPTDYRASSRPYQHLRKAVRKFVHHYHEERPHQGLDNELIAPTTTVMGTGQMNCRERLGGLLKFYYREAA
jgi:transposase InsO family protein